MTLLGYTVNLSFANAPSVVAQKRIVDSATGEEKIATLHFNDDDARAIVAMVPNPSPGGTGTVSHPKGQIDHNALDAAITARLTETPKSVADRVKASDEARKASKAAEVAKVAAEAAQATAEAAMAVAERAERDAIARKVALETEIALLEDQAVPAIVAKNLTGAGLMGAKAPKKAKG